VEDRPVLPRILLIQQALFEHEADNSCSYGLLVSYFCKFVSGGELSFREKSSGSVADKNEAAKAADAARVCERCAVGTLREE
jgi:hypothetical protein